MERYPLVDEIFGLDTEVAVLDDGIMLGQGSMTRKDSVFLTFGQLRQLEALRLSKGKP